MNVIMNLWVPIKAKKFLGRLTVSQTGPRFKELVDYYNKVLRVIVRTTISCLSLNRTVAFHSESRLFQLTMFGHKRHIA